MGRLTHTVSGDIAYFRTPSRVPIESLKFHFLPKQASGTPSPDNPIPIEGWTGLNGKRAGKNIAHVMWSTIGGDADAVRKLSNNYGTSIDTLEYIKPDGRIVVTQTKWDNPSIIYSYMNGYVAPIIDTLERDKYYDVSFKITNITSNPLNASLSDWTLSNPYGIGHMHPVIKDDVLIFKNYKHQCRDTAPNRKHFEIRICGMNCTISELMITPVNSNDGVFELYSGEQIPITFPDGETIYGGYVDPVAGEIVAEYAIEEPNSRKWNIGLSRAYQWGHTKGKSSITYSKTNVCTHWINNKKSYYEQESTVDINENGALCIGKDFFTDAGIDFDAITSEAIEAYLTQLENSGTPFRVCYPLETPIHITIPSEDMKAFLDHNNFWSDANDITEVTYAITESKDILATRKRIMSQTWDMIPLKYQPVEYISAKDSNPYIDMGIQFVGECEAEVHYYNDKNEAFLFGVRKGSGNSPYCNFNVESTSADRSRFDYGNKKATASSGLPFAGYHDGEYIFKFHSRTATMEKVSTGEIITKDYGTLVHTDYPDYNMYLFSVNTAGTPSLNTGTGELRVYSAKFWLGGQLVRDFVPCVRKADSKPGMYDRVSKTFFINVGSGEFTIPT